MRARRITLFSLGGLLAAFVAVAAWLWFADLGVLKPNIERWVSEQTGREFAIDGALSIDLAGRSVVIAENVRLQNADWDQPEQMVSVDRIEVHLDLGSLFGDGPVVIEMIDIDGADVYLTQRDDGSPNWQMQMGEPAEAPAEVSADTEPGKGVVLRNVSIDNSNLQYASPVRSEPIALQLDSLRHEHRADDFLEFSLTGVLSDEPLSISGEIGTWPELLAASRVQFVLDTSLGDFRFEGEGEIDDLASPRRPTLTFSAYGPDIDELTAALKMGVDGSGDIRLNGTLQPVEQGPLKLDVNGNIGRVNVDAKGEASDLFSLESFDLAMALNGPDLRPLLALAGIRDDRAEPFDLDFEARREGATVIVERANAHIGSANLTFSARIPQFPDFDDSHAALKIQGPQLERFRQMFNLPGVVTGEFLLDFVMDIDDDGIQIVNLELQTPLAQMLANGGLGRAPDYYDTTLNFNLQTENLGRLTEAYGIDGIPEEPAQASGRFHYTADGIHTDSEFQSETGKTHLRLDGLIKAVSGAVGSDLEFELFGENLAALLDAFGVSGGVPAEAYDLDGKLAIEDGAYRFEGVMGHIGQSDVVLDGRLVEQSGLVGSEFSFDIDGDALEEIVATITDFDVEPGPFELSGTTAFVEGGVDLRAVRLTRDAGEIDVNGVVGAERTELRVHASGPNVQSLMRHLGGVNFDPAPFDVSVNTVYDGESFAFDEANALIGELKLRADGKINLAGDVSETDLEFSMTVPDISKVGQFGDFRFLPQPASANARMHGTASQLRIDHLQVNIGESDLRGTVAYTPGEVASLEVDLDAERLVLKEREEDEDPDEPAPPAVASDRLIPDVPVPFESLRSVNAQLAVDIGHFEFRKLHLTDVFVDANLQSGTLTLEQLSAFGSGGGFIARGQLDGSNDNATAELDMVARGFAPGIGITEESGGLAADMDISLASNGADLRSLLGNSNGVLFLHTTGGQFENHGVADFLFSDALDQIFSAINPFRETQKYTRLECIIVPVEVVDGVVASTPTTFVATGKLLITLKSAIDLKSEGIELNVRTTPRKGISISAGEILNPYIKVVGTLAKPRLAVDETGVLLSGGAAIVTGGLSVLAKAAISRLAKSKDPCGEAAADGVEEIGDRFPDLAVPQDTTSSPGVPLAAETES